MAAWPLDGGVTARWRRGRSMAAGPLDGCVAVKEKVETARPLGYCLLSCPNTVAVGRPGKVTMTVASCLEGYLTRPQVAGLPSSRQEG
jgi:hypothetical protein